MHRGLVCAREREHAPLFDCRYTGWCDSVAFQQRARWFCARRASGESARVWVKSPRAAHLTTADVIERNWAKWNAKSASWLQHGKSGSTLWEIAGSQHGRQRWWQNTEIKIWKQGETLRGCQMIIMISRNSWTTLGEKYWRRCFLFSNVTMTCLNEAWAKYEIRALLHLFPDLIHSLFIHFGGLLHTKRFVWSKRKTPPWNSSHLCDSQTVLRKR